MAAQASEMGPQSGEARTAGERPRTGGRRLLAVGASTVVVSTIANVLIAQALAAWLQVPATFTPLLTVSVTSFTIVGVTGAAVVFALLTRIHPNPVAAFRVIAALALVISWIPDGLVWASHLYPGTTGPAVLSLMAMHAVAAGLAVVLLGQFGLAPGRRGE